MDFLTSCRYIKWFASAILLCGALVFSSCDQFVSNGNREAQFLARRVEALEKKVGELEGEVARLRAGAPASASGSGMSGSGIGAGAGSVAISPGVSAGGGSGAVSISNQSAESLKSDVDRTNILMLRAKQLMAASRKELPELISSFGVPAPEVDGLKAQIKRLEAQRPQSGVGSSEGNEVEAEIRRLQYLLDIACEGVRQKVLKEGREALARLYKQHRLQREPRRGKRRQDLRHRESERFRVLRVRCCGAWENLWCRCGANHCCLRGDGMS